MKKVLLISFLFMTPFLAVPVKAQKSQYFTSLGGRLNNLSGISFKQFSHRYRGNALEVVLASYQVINPSSFGYAVVGLYEHQKRLPYFRQLGFPFDFFYGAGLHCGYYSDIVLLGSGDPAAPVYLFSGGPTGIIGIERKFRKMPITLGIDYRPFYEVRSKRLLNEIASITLRYVFE